MKVYSITYWPPGGSSALGTVNATEFVFTETHVIFLGADHEPIYTMPLSLQPIIRYAGDVNDG